MHAQTGHGGDAYDKDDDEDARGHGARRHRPKQPTATSTPLAPPAAQAFPTHRSVASEDQGSIIEPTTGVEHLLEATFVRPGGQPGAPVTVNALSETLRERRGNRDLPFRNVFGTSVPRSRHTRRATSGVDGGSGGSGSGGGGSGSRAFTQTGQAALARPVVHGNARGNVADQGSFFGGRRRTEVAEWAECGRNALEERAGGDEDDWDPFASVPETSALPQSKSDMLLSVGDLADRDPRKAAMLMTKRSYFVAVGEGAPLSAGDRRRRDSDRGGAPSTSNSRRFSRRDNRRKSSEPRVQAPAARITKTPKVGANALLSSSTAANSTGGYAFSCDAKAQRAEIAMILGHRAGPMPRTVPLDERRSSLKVERIERARISTTNDLPSLSQGSFPTATPAVAGGEVDCSGGRGTRAAMLQRHASYTAGSERSLLSAQSFAAREKRSADMDSDADGCSDAACSTHDDSGERKSHSQHDQQEEQYLPE